MTSTLREVLADVLRRVTPSQKERRRILTLAEDLMKKVKAAGRKKWKARDY